MLDLLFLKKMEVSQGPYTAGLLLLDGTTFRDKPFRFY